jgi:hypothetical protein
VVAGLGVDAGRGDAPADHSVALALTFLRKFHKLLLLVANTAFERALDMQCNTAV